MPEKSRPWLFLLGLLIAPPWGAQPLVTGSVGETGGHPLAEAQVTLVQTPDIHAAGLARLRGESPWVVRAEASTDGEGRFRLLAPEPGIFRVVVHSPGQVPMQWGPAPLVQPQELPPLRLPQDVGTMVRVVHTDGSPIAGVWVFGTPEVVPPSDSTEGGWRPEFRVGRTDSAGFSKLPRREGERLEVSAFAQGLPEQVRKGVRQGVELALPKPSRSRASLRIVDPSGEPEPDILVRLGPRAWPVGVTDSAGSLVVPLSPGQEVRAHLIAPDGWRKAVRLRGVPDASEHRVVLPPLRKMKGLIVEASTGKGIPGALLWPGADPGRWGRADEEGRYEFWTPRQTLLEVRAPGYLPKRTTVSSAALVGGRGPTMALEAAGRIQGRVQESRGEAIGGASITAIPTSALGPRSFFPGDPVASRALSGSDGRFELLLLKPGQSYEVRISKPGYFPEAFSVVASPALGRAPSVEGRLSPSRTVVGEIRDSEGRPLAEAEVSLRPSRRPGHRLPNTEDAAIAARTQGLWPTVRSDSEGRFSIDQSPSSSVELVVRKEGYAPAVLRAIDLRKGAEAVVDVGEIELKTGVVLVGQVLGNQKAPLEGAELFLTQRPPRVRFPDDVLPGAVPSATTDGEGRFRIQDLSADAPQHLVVRAPGFQPRVVRGLRLPRSEPLLLRLDPLAVLRGRVVESSGEPVAGANVSLTWQEVLTDDPERRPVGLAQTRGTRTDGRGWFEIQSRLGGRVHLDIYAPGFVPIEAHPVSFSDMTFSDMVSFGKTFSDKGNEEVLTFILEQGALMWGMVTTTAGERVARARISVGGATGFTDDAGAFALDGVALGEQIVDVFHPHHRQSRTPVHVEPGENIFDVELEAGTRVSGRVLDPTRAPVAGAEVSLTTTRRMGRRQYQVRSDADGVFVFPTVMADDYRLRARVVGLAAVESSEAVAITGEPVDDLEIFLAPPSTLSGKILGLSRDELAAVEVLAESDGGELLHGRVDAEGRYEIRHVAPRAWQVRASLWQGERVVEVRVLVSGEERVVTRDLEFGHRLSLSGRVLFAGKPLAEAVVSLRGQTLSTDRVVSTGFDGRFLLEDLPADRYLLGVTSSRLLVSHNEDLELRADRELEILVDAATLGGIVENEATGSVIPGAGLTLRPREGPDFLIADASQPGGTFHLIHIPPGVYGLTVQAEGYAPLVREIELAAGEELLDLVLGLERTAGLELRVHLASGEVPILVHVAATDEAGHTVLAQTRAPDPSGIVNLSSPPGGAWQLRVGGSGGASVTTQVTVPGEAVDLTLPPAGRLQVNIRPLASEALLATLFVQTFDGQSFSNLAPGGTVQQSWVLHNGRGWVDGLPEGSWQVRVETPDGRSWHGQVEMVGGFETVFDVD